MKPADETKAEPEVKKEEVKVESKPEAADATKPISDAVALPESENKDEPKPSETQLEAVKELS